VELQNCLVADNPKGSDSHASGLAGTWVDGGGNVLGVTARLGALASNGGPTQSLLPMPGSPAINAGHLSNVLVDARGLSRLAGAKPDAGAIETGAAPPADGDGDGLPDLWEVFHGLNPANTTDAGLDKDGDGQNALAEFKSGTDPADPKSVLRIEEIIVLPVPDPPTVRLRWGHVPGIMFQVESSSDLVQWHRVQGMVRPSSRLDGRQMLGFDAPVEPPRSYFRVIVSGNPFN
jgi:hypothetical protein